MKKFSLPKITLLVGVIIAVVLSLILFSAPKPNSVNLTNDQFSTLSAFDHTLKIAQKPHSIGTTEHERVKNYIIDELRKLNLTVREQTTTIVSNKRGLMVSYVQNIMTTIKGENSNRCVLIVGHYDSQPNTFGAADDGSAIASMLEAARALKQSKTLKNDIVFLFTDGEEAGLFGAKAFVEENPLRDSVGIVLNLEARGSSGPSITYEVSPENGWIIREYAKAVPYPIAHSIAYEVYKLLPNDSDFTPFREFGLSGFNVGFIDDFVSYHSMTDTPENLSLRSLQHHGSYIMGIANHFGNLDLTNTKARDSIYFNWLGFSLVIYPFGLNFPLAIIICVLLVSNIFIGIRTKRIQLSKLLISLCIFLVTLAITILLSWILKNTILAVYPHYSIFYSANFYNIHDYFIAFTLLSIAVFSTIYSLVFRWLNAENLLIGSILFNFILMFVLLKFIPTGAYLAIVPLLLLLIGLSIFNILNLRLEDSGWKYATILLLTILPIITLLVPLIKMFYITFGLGTIFGGVALTTILLGYLTIPIFIIYERRHWILSVLAWLFIIIQLISAHFSSDYNKMRPLQSFVSYVLDVDTKEAVWFTNNKYLDDWKKQFFTNPEYKPIESLFPNSTSSYLQNKAEFSNLSSPELHLISDSLVSGSRKTTIQISSNRNAQSCRVLIDESAKLSGLVINNKIIDAEFLAIDTVSNCYNLTYFGLNDKPLTITLQCNSVDKIKIILIESKLGLPEFENIKSMPDYIIPDKGFLSNVTLLRRTWEL